MADLQRNHDAVKRGEKGLEQIGEGLFKTVVTSG